MRVERSRDDFLPGQVLAVVLEGRLSSQKPIHDDSDCPLVDIR